MTERQRQLLKTIIEEYIIKAQPVSSENVSAMVNPKLSSATIRNEMADLIRQGFLDQPHFSAGRVPTLKGWQYYIENFLNKTDLPMVEKNSFPQIENNRENFKNLAKRVADISGQLCLVAFSSNDFYYTGLTNLFNQPEFRNQSLVFDISRLVDHLDKIIAKYFDSLGQTTEILIGDKNPFGDFCAAFFTRHYLSPKKYVLIGTLGPIRTNYQQNFSLMESIRKLKNDYVQGKR